MLSSHLSSPPRHTHTRRVCAQHAAAKCVCVGGGLPGKANTKLLLTPNVFHTFHSCPPPAPSYLAAACRSPALAAPLLSGLTTCRKQWAGRHLCQHDNVWREITGRGRNQQGCRHTGTYTPDSPLPAAAGGWRGKVCEYVYVPVTHMCTHTQQAPACQASTPQVEMTAVC
jgi:hypothetical protein